jgi:two-component system response regulator AgrA
MLFINKASLSFQLPFSEIYYFETSPKNHKLKLVTKNKEIEFSGCLSEIENMDERLFRSHRSFVINPLNISQIDNQKNMVFFDRKKSCFISRDKLRDLRNILINYG